MTTDEIIQFKFSCLELAQQIKGICMDEDAVINTANKYYQFATGESGSPILTKEGFEKQLAEWAQKNLRVFVNTA